MRAPTLLALAPLVAACVAAPPAESPAVEPPAEEARTQVAPLVDEQGLHDALGRARAWLAGAQRPDGTWSDGAEGAYDVGVTALAMLALMRATPRGLGGSRAAVVERAGQALLDLQDPGSGMVGPQLSHGYLYGHGLATLGLCELYARSGDTRWKAGAQAAVELVLRARNPYSAWRYDVPPSGDNDTSVTGWMLLALETARGAGLAVEPEAFEGGLAWIDEVTDAQTGRVGYNSPGSLSSRIERVNEHFPPDMGEAMTAVGLASRALLGETPDERPILTRHAELIRRKPPEWSDRGVDLYFWYHGTRAMKSMGGRWWEAWRASVVPTLLAAQRDEGGFAGSWDPVDVWSFAGGRTYTTALAVLTLTECR